ncbi:MULTISPECIES: hypothetical protein [Isoptericola]|uniref:hypothetical protein n=1 Tax=Isoptericola TaxID=254250 RepID=UPI00383BAE9A
MTIDDVAPAISSIASASSSRTQVVRSGESSTRAQARSISCDSSIVFCRRRRRSSSSEITGGGAASD